MDEPERSITLRVYENVCLLADVSKDRDEIIRHLGLHKAAILKEMIDEQRQMMNRTAPHKLWLRR